MPGWDSVDAYFKQFYGEALRHQVEKPLVFEQLGWRPPYLTPYPRWKWFLISAKERLNACYMHMRHGYCDDKKAWFDHEC
jgi:hypothetical protein